METDALMPLRKPVLQSAEESQNVGVGTLGRLRRKRVYDVWWRQPAHLNLREGGRELLRECNSASIQHILVSHSTVVLCI